MTPKTLRVRAHGDALVHHYERLSAGTLAFVGRRYQELSGRPGEYGFVPIEDPIEVPNRPEYIRALQAGDLTAADEDTARAAGIDLRVSHSRGEASDAPVRQPDNMPIPQPSTHGGES